MTTHIISPEDRWLDVCRVDLERDQLDPDTNRFLDLVRPGWSTHDSVIEVETRRARVVLEMLPDDVDFVINWNGRVRFKRYDPDVGVWARITGSEQQMRRGVAKALANLAERLSLVGHEDEYREAERERRQRILDELVPDNVEVRRGVDGKVEFRSREFPGVWTWSWADGAEDRQRRLVTSALARLATKLAE